MHAALVGSGILLSRILGLVRESLKARYLGASGSIAADAFHAAFRIPNLLQNLFGEGALSAAFIPVYSSALARGNRADADRLAGAVGALLGLLTAVLVLAGILLAPALVALIAPGFTGERREFTIQLTRILFPGAALFVFSAWCLGILNSHRRFFLSYAAPVAWNLAMIVALLAYGPGNTAVRLAVIIAWASVIGAGLQFLVQLPTVLKVAPALKFSLGRGSAAVAQVRRNFVPAFLGRGVAQINAYVDQFIASFLPIGAVSLLFYTQTLTMLPVSLFGMSVAAAELPEMSSAAGDAGDAERATSHVRERLLAGLRRIAYFVVPSAVAFLLLGDVIAGALYQRGRFTATDTMFTWGILAAASIGLLATTLGRLYSSAFYAFNDTRTPFRIALVRVTLAAGLGYVFAMHLPRALGLAPQWGTAALALSSSAVGWIEFLLLRASLGSRLGATGVPGRLLLSLVGAAFAAGAAAFGVKLLLGDLPRIPLAIVVLALYGAAYLGATRLLRVSEAESLLARALKVVRR